jgi:hypothetical protein
MQTKRERGADKCNLDTAGYIALGALLLLVQLGLHFAPEQDTASTSENPAPALTHKTTVLPAIVGGLSLILGVGLYLNNRNKLQE